MNAVVNKIKADKSPLYVRARDELVAQIETGALKSHDALPSERVLAEQMGISRMTARQALAAVEKEGFAYRNGRKGRFVADKRLSYDIGTTLSFTTKALRESINLTIEVISLETVAAGQALATKLKIEVGELVHSYKRLFKVDGQSVLIEREAVVAKRFPDLLQQDLRQSSTALLEAHYGVIGRKGQLTVRCVPITDENKTLLGSNSPPYGMEVELIVYDGNGNPFCFGRQIWCSEMAEFTVLTEPS
jgi:GntR family transcriptional regulator